MVTEKGYGRRASWPSIVFQNLIVISVEVGEFCQLFCSDKYSIVSWLVRYLTAESAKKHLRQTTAIISLPRIPRLRKQTEAQEI